MASSELRKDKPDAKQPPGHKLPALYEFSRPHTIIATTCQTFGLFIVISAGSPLTLSTLRVLLLAWIASLAANLYVVGLNQIYDQEIDRINKPYLPLASGAFSRSQAWGIVLFAGIAALLLGGYAGSILLATLLIVMFLGTIYSIPPLRLKKRPFWAALSIALARGVVANGGLMLYFSQALAPKETLSTQTLLFIVAFFFLFGIVIALYKDIPDWSGDRQFQINTYAVTFGEKKVFQFGRLLLTGMYMLPIAAGLLLLPRVSGLGLALMHAGALIVFWIKSQKINPEKSASMMSLYLFLWGLFYTEYIFFAIYRLLAANIN